MRVYPPRRKDPVTKIEGTKSFAKGLSQLGHPSSIKPDELSESKNVMYTLNGVLEKRLGSQNLGSPRGSSTKVNEISYVSGIAGNDYFLRISDDGILQKWIWASSIWSDVSGSPTFSNVKTKILQSWGKVYIMNDTDPFTMWDGTTFTYKTALTDPTTAPSVSKTGTGTGSRQYYYRYAYQNDGGNTLASNNVLITGLPEKLDASTFVVVTMPGSAPSGATKTMIFRGTTSGDEVFLASIPASTLVYNDKDFDVPDTLFGIPADNTTGGMHFVDGKVTVFNDTLIGVTKELGAHCLVYSAGGDKIDSFGKADGAGFFFWKKDDGSEISGIHEYQESLYVFKTNKIGYFKFTTDGAQMGTVSLASGAVSQDSIHSAGNDLRYWDELGAMSLGNEPNMAGIRTKVMSARADRVNEAITKSEKASICGVFYKSHSLWGIPQGSAGDGNTTTVAYNEKFSAWSEWSGLNPSQWVKVTDPDKNERLFFSDSQSGNVCEAWVGKDDRGNSISMVASTKQFDANVPYRYKTYNRVYFVFGNVSGSSTRVILTENGVTQQTPRSMIISNSGDQGFGVDEWGDMSFGDSSGDAPTTASSLNIRFADVGYKDLFSLQATFTNDGLADSLQIMGMFIEYSDSSLPLGSELELPQILE